jgi:pescadillo
LILPATTCSIASRRLPSHLPLSLPLLCVISALCSLRNVFLSVKGIYFKAEIRGIPIVWLQPWSFSQWIPGDVDYKVMLTFLDFYDTLLQFIHFKLYHSIGCSYPPKIRADVEALGGHLAAVDAVTVAAAEAAGAAATAAGAAASSASSASAASASASAADASAKARITSLKAKMASIVAADGGGSSAAVAPVAGVKRPREEKKGAPSAASASAASTSTSSLLHQHSTFASLYDSFAADNEEGSSGDGKDGGSSSSASAAAAAAGGSDQQQLADMAAFADSDEAKAVIEKAKALDRFTRLFSGLVFFLNREVPREAFEFIICSFRGRVGWDGPGSPYGVDDPRITHQVVDRPMPADTTTFVAGRNYVQPQWVCDSVNARMLLPTAKYAPGATLPVSYY